MAQLVKATHLGSIPEAHGMEEENQFLKVPLLSDTEAHKSVHTQSKKIKCPFF